jgi:hypothetical protein
MRFRVLKPLLAIRHEPGVAAVLITIGPGSVITVRDEVEETGFVDVFYEGQIVKVFMLDIEKKTDRVNGQAG